MPQATLGRRATLANWPSDRSGGASNEHLMPCPILMLLAILACCCPCCWRVEIKVALLCCLLLQAAGLPAQHTPADAQQD
jgi:hypothetical protein